MASSQEFLWRVRYALYMLAGRAEDRLLFDHQRSIARLFGYEDNDVKLAVERFMQKVLPGGDGDLRAERPDHPALRGSHPACEQPVQINR